LQEKREKKKRERRLLEKKRKAPCRSLPCSYLAAPRCESREGKKKEKGRGKLSIKVNNDDPLSPICPGSSWI